MEIVTEPDMRSAEEAYAFVKELRNVLLEIGTCDCKMEGKFIAGSLILASSIQLF